MSGPRVKPRHYDVFDVRGQLRRACDRVGGVDAFAEKHRLAPEIIASAVNGLRDPSILTLQAIGFVRVTRYLRLKGRRAR